MEIRHPDNRHIGALRELWKIAFGDPDDFLDIFFRCAYASDRCRCIFMEDRPAAVLYWFDCDLQGQKMAYIYAVATHPDFRGRGFCRMLMEDTHALLKARGYDSAILVPQKESLRKMYAGMGYRDVGGLEKFSCEAGVDALPVRAIGAAEFASLRRKLLPEGSVLQEGENLNFLAAQLQFFAAESCLMAAWAEKDTLHAMEFLGSRKLLPGILKALGFVRGTVRMPGKSIPFAMFHPLTETAMTPQYFGFAFD